MGNSKSSKSKSPTDGKTKKKKHHASHHNIATPVSTASKSMIDSNAAAKVAASKMPVDIYYTAPSVPCRAVMMTARVIGLDLNLKHFNMAEGDHMKPEFLKINPQHTLPTMNDNGFIIWESRAIMGYLVGQYSKDDSLYPNDAKARATVDQRLYFDVGTLYARFLNYYLAFIFTGAPMTPDKLKSLEEALSYLNTMLNDTKYLAADHLTIADISVVPTITNMLAFGYEFSAYPNIQSWYARAKETLKPYGFEEIDQAGANIVAGFLKAKMVQS